MTDTFDLTNPLKPKILVDPNAVLDYPFDWTEWLDDLGDTIASAQVLLIGTVLLDSSGHPPNGFVVNPGNKIVVAWAKGFTKGSGLTCHIVTAGGRQDDRSIYFNVKDR